MTYATTVDLTTERKPAAWLVAAGIVAAITLSVSCLTILMH